MTGFSFPKASLHVRQDAFKWITASDGVTTVIDIMEIDNFLAAAPQHQILVFPGQLVKRRIHLEAVVGSQRSQHLKIIDITPIPAPNGALGQGQGFVHDDALLIEKLLHAQTVTTGTGTRGVIE